MGETTYKSRFTIDSGFPGLAFFTLLKLSLKLIGIREVPGMFAIDVW